MKMRILQTVNICPTNLSEKLGIGKTVLGGWVEAMAEQLKKRDDVELGIACKTDCDKDVCVLIDNVKYYTISYKNSKTLEDFEKRCKNIYDDFKPDIVHIEGTEFVHSSAMMNVCDCKSVVSLQGILHGYYDYQCGMLQMDELMLSSSLTEIVTGWLLHLRKRYWFKKRLKSERRVMEKADYFIGRTSWDKAHSYTINPSAEYFSCCRILRKPFYTHFWGEDGVEEHSLYVGNGYNALKGVHFVISALPQLIREYPDVKVYVGGTKPFCKGDKRPLYKRGYGAYVERLIKKLGVEEHIEFLGELNAEQVASRLAKTHAYILCSTIENSPNTLGEAMMIGTPSVAAYVGGVSDMAVDREEALFFRSGDPSYMAWRVKEIFDNPELAKKLSENGKRRARKNHDEKENVERLLEIYKAISEGGK